MSRVRVNDDQHMKINPHHDTAKTGVRSQPQNNQTNTMNENKDLIKADEKEIVARPIVPEKAQLDDADLENVTGGFLDAHGDVCVSVGAGMSTVTTGGSNKNNG